MIEIAFNESAAGALKFAKSMKQGDLLSGATAVFGGDANQRREAAKPRVWQGSMDGSPNDVAELMLELDIGDISDTTSGLNKRKELLDLLFSDFPGVSDEIWETDKAALKRLDEAKATLEPVRMWVCAGNPAELCGMYFVCRLMAGAGTPLLAVIVPEQIEKDGCIINYRGTGDIEPESLCKLASHAEKLSELRRSVYAGAWDGLVRENAPLRAVVNGGLMGAPESFYDFALRANIQEGEFTVAQLIGRTLGVVRGVSDRWLFMRVQAMLKSGELNEVRAATADHPYSGVVKRNGGYGR